MPLTTKGRKIKQSMRKTYGAEKAEQVFHASRNAGTISGVDRSSHGSMRAYMQNRHSR